MANFDDPDFYGDRWADVYDERHGGFDPKSAVEFLAGLAGNAKVLELGIGTGRVALPLASRGVAVEGVDASAAMLERLRAKPGGDSIPVTFGDMADVPVSGSFGLVYLVFNTLFGLLSQDRQADCFRNVARVLEPGGAFVIECFVPDLSRIERGQRVRALDVTEESATFEVVMLDVVQQRITSQVITLTEQRTTLRPVAMRYSWPAELDLIASSVGLHLAERHADWQRRPFESTSGGHVSVYRRV